MHFVKRLLLVLVAMTLLFTTVSFAAPSPTGTNLDDISAAAWKQVSKKGTYNGEKQAVKISVTLNGVALTEGVDYIVENNLTKSANAGEYKVKPVIQGIGKYQGTITCKKLTYTIKKASQKVTGTKSYTVKRGIKFQMDLSASTKLVYSAPAGIKVSSKGVVTISKKCKKGTYSIKVYAKESKNYKQSATKTIKIKVK